MSRSLEPTLLSLLPALPSAASLPQPLVELASSLLAQSRHHASTLKAEEEVARLYACAHIACERLKTSLDLPPINVRPPIPPKYYHRLYSHLDRILPASSAARIRTPSGKARDAGGIFGSGSGSRMRSRATPSKDAALAQFRSRNDATPTKSTPKPALRTSLQDGLPPWVKPTIQFVCTRLDNARIGRTVQAGMQTIVLPRGKRTTDEWINSHITSLLAAIYFMVTTRFVILETGKQFGSGQYAELRRDIVGALKQARAELDKKGADDEVFWDGWSTVGSTDVDKGVKQVTENRWQEEEWFSGIQDQLGSAAVDLDANVDMDEETAVDGEKTQGQRGDTMFQGRWVMDDRRREEYRDWKAGIMKRVEEIEKADGGAMAVDVSASA
jgi:origin recognition complex subunit 6